MIEIAKVTRVWRRSSPSMRRKISTCIRTPLAAIAKKATARPRNQLPLASATS